MLRFEVRALAKDGVVALNLDAADARAAAQLAAERGYAVLSVARRAAPRRGRDRFALVLFTQELLALLRAGLGLVEAIQALAERQTGAGASGYLDAVLRALRDGHPLSTALKVAPAAFPPIYVETVRAAERTGALVEALERYVAFQIQVERIRQQLVSASIYPLLLIAVGTLVAPFLLGYVVPRFSGIYADMGRELPVTSRLLFELGGLIDRHAVGVAAAAATLAVTAALLVRSGATTRRVRDR